MGLNFFELSFFPSWVVGHHDLFALCKPSWNSFWPTSTCGLMDRYLEWSSYGFIWYPLSRVLFSVSSVPVLGCNIYQASRVRSTSRTTVQWWWMEALWRRQQGKWDVYRYAESPLRLMSSFLDYLKVDTLLDNFVCPVETPLSNDRRHWHINSGWWNGWGMQINGM